MNFLIVGEILPASESLPLRYLTLLSHDKLDLEVLIECDRQKQDFYYKYARKYGLFDYVEDIVYPEFSIEGIRLDTSHGFPLTIVTDKVDFKNFNTVLGQVINLANISKKT